ncbi:MAG: 8-amino-7-oxononanoate synthase [Muribaculaceae bacterium]|nr:8-amino-7-oxononanoate synthase [Muribaculaceae bacterium]
MAAKKSSVTKSKSASAKSSTVRTRNQIKRPAAEPLKVYSQILDHLRDDNRFRIIPEDFPRPGRKSAPIDLLSNDYLGLGAEAGKYKEEFLQRFPDATMTSSASRLLSRRNKYHNRLESFLEELYGRPALLFNSGYHANVGIIQALAVPSTMFIADKLVHASAIDGLRLSEADFKRFPHNSISRLRRILNEHYDDYERFVVIVESIYSMDGDISPLRDLAALKKEYPKVILYVDEAHSFGVRGERGLGLCEELSLLDDVDIIVGTLGKAAASAGAFVICPQMMKDYLINSTRSFIFSTALSPAQAAWSILMIEKIISMSDRRKHLKDISREFVGQMERRNNIETPSTTQIVPMIIGDAGEAMLMADYLRSNGFDTLAIRKPTVPAGSERIRFSLNALLTKKDITRLVGIIGKYR